jgi:hypothetical protein
VACVVLTLDAAAYDQAAHPVATFTVEGGPPQPPEIDEETAKRARALRHALAEYELTSYAITPGRPLGEILVR